MHISLQISVNISFAGRATRRCEFYDHGDPKNLLQDIQEILSDNKKLEPRFEPQAMVLVFRKKEAFQMAQEMNHKTKNKNFAVAVTSDRPEALEEFTKGSFRVAITCGIAKEGYDNSNVVACVIHRRIVTSRILFQQFVGRCNRINTGLGGEPTDRSIGVVRSYKVFGAKILWENMNKLAAEDPVEVDEDVEDGAEIKQEHSTKRIRLGK